MAMARNELITLQQLHEFGHLELLARQVVEGFIIGLHKSPFHGFSVEFAEHRLYNPGESVRNVDWKVYARTDRMYVKKYEEETNLRCQIVLDCSSSMYYPEDAGERGKPAINKIRFGALAAASLMHLLKMQRDAFGLTLFRDQILEHTQARSTTMHYRLLLSHLEQVVFNPERNKGTGAVQVLHEVAESLHRRSLVIVMSDMLDNLLGTESEGAAMEEMFRALQHLKYNKHEVILIHIMDRQHELEFGFDNRPYLFVDLESGEKVRLQSSQVKQRYVEQVQHFKKELQMKCAQYKIDFVEADIRKDFSQVLTPYLLRRGKLF
jgi:uncharacterized protein (DUF58 family)